MALTSALMFPFSISQTIEDFKGFTRAANEALPLSSRDFHASNNGKLVILRDEIHTSETLRDSLYGVISNNSVTLERHVEYYQWRQSDTIINIDTTDTTSHSYVSDSTKQKHLYSYELITSSWELPSSGYDDSTRRNDIDTLIDETQFHAAKAFVGLFNIDSLLISKLRATDTLELDKGLKGMILNGITPVLYDNYFFYGNDPQNPVMGDFKVFFTAASSPTVSILAKQQEKKLTPYQLNERNDLYIIKSGYHSPENLLLVDHVINVFELVLAILLAGIHLKIGLFLFVKPIRVILFIIKPSSYLLWMIIDKIFTWGITLSLVIFSFISLFSH